MNHLKIPRKQFYIGLSAMSDVTENAKTKNSQSKKLMVMILIVLILLVLFVWMLSVNQKDNTKTSETHHLSDPLIHADPESMVLEKVQRGIAETKKETDNLKKQLDDEIIKKDTLNESKQKALEERLASLEKQLAEKIDTSSGAFPSSNGEKYHGQRLVVPAGYQNDNAQLDNGLREDKLTLTTREDNTSRPLKNPDTYVPAGTTVPAIMLSGADASAAVTSPHNPNPMIFRIIEKGTLPNHKTSHLKDCTVLAQVVGDISSERGEINIEKMSCVFPNNQIIDPKVEGWVFGRDGKYGVRGRPVWREGKLLQRAFAAGALSGISEGISQSYTTNSISPLGNTQTTNNGKILQVGAARGAGKAMDKLADYNIQRAEQYHPVIQISPGDVVDIVFKEGFFLDGKKHDHEEESKNIPNLFGSTASASMTQAAFLSPDEKMLPLSADQVKRIQENSKQLGFKVTGDANARG
jgi:conjugal transfer pilus assembly protein TraB